MIGLRSSRSSLLTAPTRRSWSPRVHCLQEPSSQLLSDHLRPLSSSSSVRFVSIEKDLDRDAPVSWGTRAKEFPNNVWKLFGDLRRYKYIMDVKGQRRTRRQQEQMRMVIADIRVVLPTVLLWIPPVIGVLPMFLAILTPRQVLSRQFFNTYEKESFAMLEYQQRRPSIEELSNILINQFKPTATSSVDDCSIETYSRSLPSLQDCTRTHLKTLALATGYAQRFPAPMAKAMVELSPDFLLRYEINQLGQDIVRDDNLLMEESYHEHGCEGMTDAEVLEACLVRGMPVSTDYQQMRQTMTNHLKVIEELKTKLRPDEDKVAVTTLHLPAIRLQQKKQSP